MHAEKVLPTQFDFKTYFKCTQAYTRPVTPPHVNSATFSVSFKPLHISPKKPVMKKRKTTNIKATKPTRSVLAPVFCIPNINQNMTKKRVGYSSLFRLNSPCTNYQVHSVETRRSILRRLLKLPDVRVDECLSIESYTK